MFKKLAVLIVLLLAMTLSACSNAPEKMSLSATDVASFDGTWNMEDSSPEFAMVAKIANDTIEITWISEDTRGLYWKGTFSPEGRAHNGMQIVSQGDTAAMDASMLGSLSKTKEFTYKDNALNYDFEIQGVIRTISLKR